MSALKGHPKGLYLIFATSTAERFSYYGMRAIFILFLTQALLFDKEAAASIYGSYTGLVYLTPLIGGYIADKYWGIRRSVFWGAVMMAVGQFLMFMSASTLNNTELAHWLMYGGLGFLILGNGCFKPTVSSLVGQLYEPGDKRLDAAYTIFYMGVNVGSFAAPLICGYLGDTGDPHDFKWGFLAAGIMTLFTVVLFETQKNKYLFSPSGEAIGIIPDAKREKKEDKADHISHPKMDARTKIRNLIIITVLAHFYFGLCAINLKTNQSRMVWQRNSPQEDGTLMASSMYFEPSDSSFYAVSMSKGGVLWKISMKDSVYTEVSKPIYNESNYQDCDFSLYSSPAHGKLFLVLDKILNDHTHNVYIYSINMPLVNEGDIRQSANTTIVNGHKYLYITGIILLLIAAGMIFYRSRCSNRKDKTITIKEIEEVPVIIGHHNTPEQPLIAGQHTIMQEKGNIQETDAVSAKTTNYYDRSRASISLCGCFNVRDKDGNDITSNFTPRLKHLLILLILYTEKNEQGILASKTTEILWPEKEETSARNNRNVNLRKLRVLLESIGDVEVITENNFLRIKWGTTVFCDYHTLLTCTQQFEQEKSEELLNRILELLLYGPLLPNTIFDWLDDFKDAYSSHSIDLLKNLLDIEIQRNHQEMIIRLADIMFLHDPLNEEALAAKCAVLSAQGKKGIARNLYDRFCKEYRDSMGENYKIPFADL